jgi:hypothetical protein
MVTASANQNPYRVKVISPSEYHFLLCHLEESMAEYEAFTRKNSGSVKGGIRVLHGDTFSYAKYALEMAWKHLHAIKQDDLGRYMSIVSGAEGQFIPVRLSTTGYASLNQHTSRERSEFKNSDQIRRKANGKATDLHNSERSVLNWRNKLTSSVIMYHANGATSPGFDLFSEWMAINAAGILDKKGRCGVIGYINLKYVLGGTSFTANSTQDTENQPNTTFSKNALNEESSAITPIKNLKNKKKKELSGKIENEAAELQPEKTRFLDDQQDAESIQPDVQLNAEKKGDQPPGCAAPPSSRYNAAIQLWLLLMARIYLPMLKAGRVRYNAEKTCMKHDFSKEIQQKAMVSLEEILRQYSAATLKEAIEKQAAWLENDEKRWIYTPGTFLDTTMKNGSLVSAVRELVRPAMPEQRTEMPGESLSLDQRIDILYQKILDLGCKNTRKYTFLAWSRKYGMDYMCRIYKMFRDEIYRRRLNGAPVGQEFVQGSSRKFAHMVYYGNERLSEFMRKEVSGIQKQLILDCNTPRWVKSIAKVRALNNDDIAALNRLSNQYLGIRLSKFGDLEKNRNAVFLAWTYEVFWFHKAQNSTINNI